MATFSYSPDQSASLTKSPRVRSIQFGDGYQQRVPDGLNTQPRTWSLTFNRNSIDIVDIEAFLVARNGVEAFDWTPYTGLTGKWVCSKWALTELSPDSQVLSAVFTEVFGA
ncbi:MAG: phage tail protein [Gammaproteobacteria bacterium]|nr:phage tail protein [Gammaproteobacteria bacterium]